ncbi:hypothetical protein [Nocardioides perillae]|uniref:Uncharacterized protein n=1 Tax=Nocardioides perillae TaxID=1119534 RepID=A0A7Y9RYS1_9ACTN|nr:hypothetical protein [Nocardioides perillae]NYG56405.1 hypothetical protein [Nocardioides perillae]
MLTLVLSMLLITLVAGVVVAYVAFPHRGRPLPAAPWLGDALRRGVDALPTVAEEEREAPAARAPALVPAQRAPRQATRDRG